MARGRIVIDLFTTLDGVAQAPGGPQEDTSGGFRFGGWQAPFDDDMVGQQVTAYIESMDALLLGRRTYDIFSSYWPHHTNGPEGFIGRTFTEVPKYVVSNSTLSPTWENTTQLGDDVAVEVDALRDRHRETHVVGSIGLAQTLLAASVFDELRLWVYPIVLGEGRRVFPEGAAPATLHLIEPPLVGSGGVVQVRYAPAGPVVTSDITDEG